jgi:TrmH family RNA methyltransferase
MLNFGLCDLRLVDPACDATGEEAVARACGATALLERARTYGTVREAVEDCGVVLATTARSREMALPVLSARAAAERAVASCASGGRAALLFGCEKNGLSQAELRSANAIVTIPTDPLFSSLNLAQAVLLLAYECQLSREAAEPQPDADAPSTEEATAGQLASLFDFWEASLWRSRFFGGGGDGAQERLRADSAMDKLRALVLRAVPTTAEARLLRGALQALVEPKTLRSK